jgi:hypothetical protein
MQQNLVHPGNLEIELSLRPSDFLHSRDAILARTEEVIALDRIPFQKVEALRWGFLLTPPRSKRFLERYKNQATSHHLWLDSIEADHFGTQVLFSHEFIVTNPVNPFHRPINYPFGTYVAVCSWRDVSQATAYLRQEHIGPALSSAYDNDFFAITSDQITQALGLSEGSFNSLALPHYCPTQWGTLLRIDRDNAQRVLDYFNLESPAERSLPTIDKLGGGLAALYAFSPAEEALRIAICSEEQEHLALHDLGNWLRSFESPKVKKELAQA